MQRKGKKALSLAGGLVLAIGLLAASSASVDRAASYTSEKLTPNTSVVATPASQGWTISGTRSYLWAVDASSVKADSLLQASDYSWSD